MPQTPEQPSPLDKDLAGLGLTPPSAAKDPPASQRSDDAPPLGGTPGHSGPADGTDPAGASDD